MSESGLHEPVDLFGLRRGKIHRSKARVLPEGLGGKPFVLWLTTEALTTQSRAGPL